MKKYNMVMCNEEALIFIFKKQALKNNPQELLVVRKVKAYVTLESYDKYYGYY